MNKKALSGLAVLLLAFALAWFLVPGEETSFADSVSTGFTGGAGETGPTDTVETEDTSGSANTILEDAPAQKPADTLPEDGEYTSRDDVALYLHLYGHLPGNFITKSQARALGWSGGGLEEYAPGKSIGGDRFGNYEGLLPEAAGREYRECDIDTAGASSRGSKRIVYSNDGLIYYTADHYESFTLLYGEMDDENVDP